MDGWNVRLWQGVVVWRRKPCTLNPFSSRICFSHIWQYQRSLCSPLALMRFPTAFAVMNPAFGIVYQHRTVPLVQLSLNRVPRRLVSCKKVKGDPKVCRVFSSRDAEIPGRGSVPQHAICRPAKYFRKYNSLSEGLRTAYTIVISTSLNHNLPYLFPFLYLS